MRRATRYQHCKPFREKRADGPTVWVTRYRVDAQQMKEIIGTVDQFPTLTAATKASEGLRARVNRGVRSPRTFGELAAHYIEHELPRNTSPYYQEVFQDYYLNMHILPAWGAYKLSDIKAPKVEDWLASVLSVKNAQPLANSVKGKLRDTMHVIFEHGCRHEFCASNPITHVRQSRKRKGAPYVPTVAELIALQAALTGVWLLLVRLAIVTGVRVSELLGLQWWDFDFEESEINLCRGIVRQNVGEMKTEASRKPVPIDPYTVSLLLNYRSETATNQDTDYLFASPVKDGQPIWPTSAMEKHIRPAAEKAGMQRIGWHTFRRAYATYVMASGASVKTAQDLLRHADCRMTLNLYAQGVPADSKAAQRSVAEMLTSVAVKSLMFPNVPATLTGTVGTA